MNIDIHPFIFNSKIYPLDRRDVDTDQIIPKQFMSGVSKLGLGKSLFFNWRYQSEDYGKPVPTFVLNDLDRQGAKILLGRENFGCGSSREHAQWALADFGIRCIIAPSFADIFYTNCIYNQILPIFLSAEQVDTLFRLSDCADLHLTIDLFDQQINVEEHSISLHFPISQEYRHILLNNLDSIALTESFSNNIREFEEGRQK